MNNLYFLIITGVSAIVLIAGIVVYQNPYKQAYGFDLKCVFYVCEEPAPTPKNATEEKLREGLRQFECENNGGDFYILDGKEHCRIG